MASRERKFAADRMLGRLAKWLRVLGQDVIYGPHLSGYGLIRAARRENRLILTRDRKLKNKQPPEFIFIESDHYENQLRQVAASCEIGSPDQLFTRCLECNTRLQSTAKASIKEKVPPYVFSTQEKFSWCPDCRRIYWPATHEARMVEELRKLGLLEPGN
ncbi:MAG TPA: Mut7-C RNAse domain-containing protein [Terriglobales bacterium]|nr:Mut7-C RNAse domain-containing protein [Terriglobales bacterium]